MISEAVIETCLLIMSFGVFIFLATRNKIVVCMVENDTTKIKVVKDE